ncbi:iron-siderophore ABC transporter substrate-binding protein [Pseudonocardia phyllosphaerae]|uniref:iron-siderophore ABC transporter substrate-binding protein n=1 Tax=Pseudonocardia phyllosphaerae TaxID=3390502 RepID=UPI00397CFBBA
MHRYPVALLAVLLLALAGCSSGDTPPPAAAPSADGAFPTTIDSALGPVTIPAEPQRVVTVGWGSQDAALALGVVPVGMPDMTGDTDDGGGILPWDKDKLQGQNPTLLNSTSSDLPFEQITALKPDVILAVNSGLTPEQYSTLSKIAPTVAYPGKPFLTSWQDQIKLVGQALGEPQKAADLQRSTEETIAKAKAAHPEFAGKKAAFGSATEPGSYNLYLQSDSRVQLLHELGFAVSPGLPTTAPSFAAKVSMEQVGRLDADVLVSWYLAEDVRRQVEANPVFQRSPAVQRKGYVPLTDPAMVYATSAVTVLSLPWMLDRYLPELSKAAKG